MVAGSKAPVRKISIVTAAFNHRTYLENAMRTLREQVCDAEIEHIVIDGGSTDGTVDLLRQLSAEDGWSHLRWISEPDRGQSDALNKGFRLATGDVIGWLNADDQYLPGALEAVRRVLTEKPDVDVLYGDYNWTNAEGRIVQVRRTPPFSRFVLHYHHVLVIPTAASFFRKRIFDEQNFLSDDFDYAMDVDFFLRLAGRGYRFEHLPQVLADFRWHDNNKSLVGAEKQAEETARLAIDYSPLLKRLPGPGAQRLGLRVLRVAAALHYWTGKMVRGYYFTQFRPPWPKIAKNGRVSQ